MSKGTFATIGDLPISPGMEAEQSGIFSGLRQLAGIRLELLRLKVRIWLMRRRLDKLSETPERASNKMRQACQQAAEETLETLIGRAPISALKAYGVNTSRINQYGYHSTGQLKGCHAHDLQRIPGIGPVRSSQILDAYRQFVEDMIPKVRLLPSSQTAHDENPVALNAIANYLRTIEECQRSLDRLRPELAKLRELRDGFGMGSREFLGNPEIRPAWLAHRDRLRRFAHTLSADIVHEQRRLDTIDLPYREAWGKFQSKPSTFYALLNTLDIRLSA